MSVHLLVSNVENSDRVSVEGTKTQQGIFIFRLVTNKQNIDVNRHVLRYGQDFSAAGKQAKVVVQRIILRSFSILLI